MKLSRAQVSNCERVGSLEGEEGRLSGGEDDGCIKGDDEDAGTNIELPVGSMLIISSNFVEAEVDDNDIIGGAIVVTKLDCVVAVFIESVSVANGRRGVPIMCSLVALSRSATSSASLAATNTRRISSYIDWVIKALRRLRRVSDNR